MLLVSCCLCFVQVQNKCSSQCKVLVFAHFQREKTALEVNVTETVYVMVYKQFVIVIFYDYFSEGLCRQKLSKVEPFTLVTCDQLRKRFLIEIHGWLNDDLKTTFQTDKQQQCIYLEIHFMANSLWTFDHHIHMCFLNIPPLFWEGFPL